MDMDEFHDWEVLQPSPASDSGNQFKFGEFGADSDGVIRNDYFSVDDDDRYLKTVAAAAADAVGAGSGAPENPNLETRDPREGSDEFYPELEVDRSESRMLEEFEGKGEIGFVLDKDQNQGGFGGIDETGCGNGNNFEEFKSGWGGNEYGGAKFEEFEDKELVGEKEDNLREGSEVLADKEHETLPTGSETVNKFVEVEVEVKNNSEEFNSSWGGNGYGDGGAKFNEFEDKELVGEKEDNLREGSEVLADKEHETLPTGSETVNKFVEVEVEVKNNFKEFNSGWGGNGYGGAKLDEFEDKALVVEKEENFCDGSEVFTEKEHEIVPTGGETMNKIVEVGVKKAEVEKKSVVWWKAPFELLKYCMFRFKPVWTFSMAAALIGFAILGHRIYKVKKKTRSLELKVTMDDKKVSQFMSRAARLNEAFSVVKRVPVIRPQLPATGVAPWPVMTKLALQEA